MSGSAPASTTSPRPAPIWLPAQLVAALGLLWLGPAVLAVLPYELGLVTADAPELDRAAWGMVVLALACLAVVAFAKWSRPPVPWRPVRLPSVLAFYLPAVLGWLVFTIVYLRAMHALGHPVPQQWGLQKVVELGAGDARALPFALAIVVAAPLAEELVFRGYLLGTLQLLLAPRLADVCTAALFGLVHGLDYALPMAVLGLVFGHLRRRHASLWPSMCAHMLHNGLVFAVALFAPAALAWMYPA